MSHSLEIREGAFVVADAHCSYKRPDFLEFLKDISTKKLSPTQLILMGDIFDALFGEIPYTHKKNQEAIKILNKISFDIEVIYLEGNHDFNLKSIFPNIKVFPISLQPVACRFENKKVLLAHGDIESDFGYKIYTTIIRNFAVLYFLRIVDFLSGHYILKRLDLYLGKKDDCKEFTGLDKFMSQRLDGKYSCDYFVEGHFHQNKMIQLKNFTYINLGAFVCNQRYFIVKSDGDRGFLQENLFKMDLEYE
jgi:UDP-2,3-diacylglucosamine hydrolase